MKTKKLSSIIALSALLIICVCYTQGVFAESRSIYIGDIITLQINTKEFTPEELSDKFQGFEIVDISNTAGGYLLSIRTFNTGEYNILLGDKEIMINVRSALNDIERDSIFEGDTWIFKPGFPFHWRILLYVFAGAFFLSSGFVLVTALIKRKTQALSPLQLFLRQSGSLSIESDDYFVHLTFYFKEYLESLFKFRIIGKTSSEILNELKAVQALEVMLPEIRLWLMECDRLKFTGVRSSHEIKQGHFEKLLNLVNKIDAQKEVTA